jgi:uncharacterized protein
MPGHGRIPSRPLDGGRYATSERGSGGVYWERYPRRRDALRDDPKVIVAAAKDRLDVEPSRQDLLRIYARTRTIAVVGASAYEDKPANEIPRYLQSQGYRIIPINPRGGEILGERVYRSLSEVDVPFDVVEVFRPRAEAEGVAEEAISRGTEVLWFQPRTGTKRAVRHARGAGLTVVAGLCMGVMHGQLGLGPGP